MSRLSHAAPHPYPLADLGRKKVVRLVSLNRSERHPSISLTNLKQNIGGHARLTEHYDVHLHPLVKDYDNVGVPGTIHGLMMDELVDALDPENTDLFLLMNIWNQDFILELAERVKLRNPDTVLAMGERRTFREGVPELEDHPFGDYLLRGQAERSLIPFLLGLLDGDLSGVPNLFWRHANGVAISQSDDQPTKGRSYFDKVIKDFPSWRQEHKSDWQRLWLFVQGYVLSIRSTLERLSDDYDELAASIDERLRRRRFADLSIPYHLLGFFFRSQKVNNLMDRSGLWFQNDLFPGFVAGKTRETYRLWKQVELDQVIQVESDGFYFEGKRISGNPALSALILGRGVTEIKINEYFSPFYFYSDFRFLLLVLAIQLYLVFLFGVHLAPQLFEHPIWVISLLPWNIWFLVIPFYLVLNVFNHVRVFPVTLWQVDQVDVPIQTERISSGNFTVVFNPNIIFTGSRSYNGLVMHERAHVAYGASESMAWTIQTAQFSRALVSFSFLNMQVLARTAEKVDLFVGFAITILRTLIFNLTALAYMAGFKRNWFEPTEQRFRQETMDVESHLDYLLENNLEHAHCSRNAIKWYDDLFVIARVQNQDELALRIAAMLLEKPVIWYVFRAYPRQFLRASFFYEIGVVCETLGREHEARINYQVVVDIAEGLGCFPVQQRLLGWARGLIAPNNETLVKAFARLATKRMQAIKLYRKSTRMLDTTV